MIGSKCDGLASQRDYFTWNDRFCDISPRWQFQPVPFTGTPILRRPYLLMFFPVRYAAWRQQPLGLFAQIPTMAACCRFSPFLRQGTFADRYRDKERCRKKKAILAGAQPLNFGHKALFISFLNVRLDQTQPVDIPSCPDGKKRLRYWNHG